MREFVIDNDKTGERLDKFLFEVLEGEGVTRSFIQKLISNSDVLVNGKESKSGYKLRASDKVTLKEIEVKELDILKENIPLDIVYEDSDLIIVNKPKGMIVHPAQNINSGTLVNALMYHCKDLSSINGVERPGIIHRIDKDTTGLLVVGKNDFAHKNISDQFKVHSIKREYIALVHGVIKKDGGRIETFIGRHPKDRIKMAVVKEGRVAITEYKVLRRYKRTTLIKCRLFTGRTHQIRVHMSHIGHPLVGDQVYGLKKDPIYSDGQLLHARVIGFIHPSKNEYMEFKGELPEYFRNLISNL